MPTAAEITASYDRRQNATSAVRYIRCLALAGGDAGLAAEIFRSRHAKDRNLGLVVNRSASAPLSASGLGAELAVPADLGTALGEVIRGRSIVGRLVGLRRVPMNTRAPAMTAGSSATWTGEGRPIPVSAATLETVTIAPQKAAGLVVTTNEVLRHSSPEGEALLERDLGNAAAGAVDAAFFNPDLDASILHGVTPVMPSGNGAADALADLLELLAGLDEGVSSPVFCMRPLMAARLGALRLGDGSPAFPNLGWFGGSIFGIPALTGDVPRGAGSGSPAIAGSDRIVLLDSGSVAFADDGLDIEVARHASIEMSTTPEDPATSGAVQTSLWQLGLIAIRVIRYVGWEVLRPGAVAYLAGANYAAATSA